MEFEQYVDFTYIALFFNLIQEKYVQLSKGSSGARELIAKISRVEYEGPRMLMLNKYCQKNCFASIQNSKNYYIC
jgi:hypothetical protein